MSVFSKESLQLRRELAYACRILAANGQNDSVYGHVTYREAGAQTFWMKPAALGLDEITPQTLIRIDMEGRVVEGQLPRHLEFPIHAEIFRARPDITCVVHTHPLYSIAFAATGQPLRAASHEGAQFTPPDVPRFTRTSDLITTRELGEEVARTMGGSLACYLLNHGIVVVGNTIHQAVVAAINLERASQVQLLASAAGQPFRWTSDEDIAGKREKIFGDRMIKNRMELLLSSHRAAVSVGVMLIASTLHRLHCDALPCFSIALITDTFCYETLQYSSDKHRGDCFL